MNARRFVTVAAIALLVAAGLGFKVQGGKMVWRFLHEPYSSNYDKNSGIPKAFDKKLPPGNDLLERINAALPEGRNIAKTNPDLITDDFGANVHLKENADVFVTFIHEGAGYKNSFGFFTFPDEAIPTSRDQVTEYMVFPNSSYHNSGGGTLGLRSGDTMKLGTFPAGTNIGFVVVANAFSSSTGVATTPVTGGPPGGDWVFYTMKALNPESAASERKAHTVLLADAISRSVVLGMEDIRRDNGSCDHDFNDIVFTVTSYPPDAIDVEDIAPMPEDEDRDGDGVLDDNDDFPDDRDRAFVTTVAGTLAFEDAWPAGDDYDFNDLVVDYAMDKVTNASAKLVEIRARVTLSAHGSDLHDGFGLAIPGLSRNDVASATIARDGGAANAVTIEAGHGNAVVYRVFDDASAVATVPAGCETFNTDPDCAGVAAPAFDLVIKLKSAGVDPALPGNAPYNPFLFRSDDRAVEVHLPNKAPTALADDKRFGEGDDDSSKQDGRYYLSFCNFPWALDVPASWAWPAEGSTVLDAYPAFGTWAESQGATSRDWHQSPVETHVWRP
ncbi:MAG: LruC domain-containing protein [Deltaproteobacteria bacterium]|nr:LruC domain-containing protein [Deltaproteobacteria bacterium]